MTLIEIIAGLALTATLLVSVLTARDRAVSQWRRSERRSAAVRVADELLSRWWQRAPRIPAPLSGVTPGEQGFEWRTATVRNDPVEKLGASVVRLEIFEKGGLDRGSEPLCAVEVVVAGKVRHDR